MNHPSTIRAALILASVLACAPACSSHRQEVADQLTPQASPPADFALALTILAPSKTRADKLPRGQRPARYLLAADGALRASQGMGASTLDFPPVVRNLRDAQRQEIWAMVK